MQQFLALTSPGIEVLLVEELKKLGAEQAQQKPEGVYFNATMEQAYKICLWSRLATRVLLKLDEGEVETKEDLTKAAESIQWHEHFSSESTFAVDFVGTNKSLRNSQFSALVVKDAIVDSFRALGEERPSVSKQEPSIVFQARLLKGKVTFYLDFSGRGLFQRGYREHSGAAPLKENLAAALVLRSGWLEDTSKPLVDIMCGSGTLLIEAALMAAGVAPNTDREYWGFDAWLHHDEDLFVTILQDAITDSVEGLEDLDIKLFGSDMDGRVLQTAKQNARRAGVHHAIDFTVKDANSLKNLYGKKGGTILFNPPYGERIGDLPEMVQTFAELGNIFKQHFMHWRLCVFTANIELLSLLKLSSFKRNKLKNGPLECQLALYNIDEKQLEKDAQLESEFSGQDSAFANRLLKNKKALKNWLKKSEVECYRLYDADIPEYNVAVDVYGEYLVIQEYAAPAKIEPEKVAKRLQEVIYFAPKTLGVPAEKVVLKTRSKQKGTNQYQKVAESKRFITVNEHGALLKVNLWDYLDTGLFLDHRKTRQIVAEKAKGKSLLNLFSYTGSVSVQAAVNGADSVTTVDMSNTYLNWAQENFALNKLQSYKYQFIQADCLKWLKENEHKFDVVFIDPPTFSNSKRMDESFDVQRDHIELLLDGMKAVAEGGELVFTNNKRNFKMDFDKLAEHGLNAKNISEVTRDKDFARNKHIHNSWVITRNVD